ncbi:unnamed protein product [Rotaria socialis]|uniref:Uncharacterized protein n=1 Tax=Rotaria socialis TaxID=392032 RepID=A0A821GCA0_9BILA|nr:unnamed protein product [Rotaria socialis]
MNAILNRLLQITIEAAESVDHQTTYGFHIYEPLAVLTKLFLDEKSLDYVLSHAKTDPQIDPEPKINCFVDLRIKFRDPFTADNRQLQQFTCTAQ